MPRVVRCKGAVEAWQLLLQANPDYKQPEQVLPVYRQGRGDTPSPARIRNAGRVSNSADTALQGFHKGALIIFWRRLYKSLLSLYAALQFPSYPRSASILRMIV
jgi:hypothetical protein